MARSGSVEACCDPGLRCCDPITTNLYGVDQTGTLPEMAVKASLGCGNPTALIDLRPGETVLDLGSGGGIDVLLSAKRVGPTGKAPGLDMTDDMLEPLPPKARSSKAARRWPCSSSRCRTRWCPPCRRNWGPGGRLLIGPKRPGLVVVKRKNEPAAGRLALPGGFMELGETWQQACTRELWEETSIEVLASEVELFDVHSVEGGERVIIFGVTKALVAVDLSVVNDVKDKPYCEEVEEVARSTQATGLWQRCPSRPT